MKKYVTAQLETERLILKKGTSKDCIKVYEYDLIKCRGIAEPEVLVKADEVIDFIGEDQEKYYNETCIKEKRYDWYLFLKGNNAPIGNVIADREIEDINSIELAINMHPDYWRKGYMTESLNAIIDYLFLIGYDNIIMGYEEGNYKSKALNEKMGFKFYKLIENSYIKNGIGINNTEMIMSKEDWRKLKKAENEIHTSNLKKRI